MEGEGKGQGDDAPASGGRKGMCQCSGGLPRQRRRSRPRSLQSGPQRAANGGSGTVTSWWNGSGTLQVLFLILLGVERCVLGLPSFLRHLPVGSSP